MKEYKYKIILVVIIIAICGYEARFSINQKVKYKIPAIDINTKYRVISVLDGDTFEIKIDKRIIKVRMLGIDTPETLDPRKPVQCFGKEASDMTKEMLIGHSVTLHTDSSQSLTDKYGRILAYIYREDGLFINEYLLENGYAREYTYNKAYKEQKEFKKIESKAKDGRFGLWGLSCLQE